MKKFISLFSGCGGSSLGYVQSGMRGKLAIDSDSLSCKNYKLNFPDSTVWNMNVEDVLTENILKTLDIEIGELDHLDFSPPCQGFSLAGKREISDIRNLLLFQTIRFINDLQPKSFIIENVDGLIKGKMKGVFNSLLDELFKLNYQIQWKSINSVYYNLPQSRQRVIIFGVRKDLNLNPIFPESKNEFILVKDVISDIEFHSRGQFDDTLKNTNSFFYTLTKTPSMYFIREGKKIKPTINELKIIQGFPKEYLFIGNYNEIWGMIGNSVPPPIMSRFGEIITSM